MEIYQDYDENLHRTLIVNGVTLLKRKKNYKQITIVNKLKYLNFDISAATLSNILNKKIVGQDAIWKTAEGIQALIKLELGMIFNQGQFLEQKERKDWIPEDIPGLSIDEPSLIMKPGFVFNEEGRYSLTQKIAFLSTAEHEVIEFGLTLRTFASHFFSRNDSEFKIPLTKLLEKGVNIKCYVLDPGSNEARLYFEDRSRILPDEKNGIESIKQSIEKLGKVYREFKKADYPGLFEVYTYKHFPYNYFMMVDGGSPKGKIAISHYIYGELRAKCPIIEFTRKHSPSLYRRYLTSLRNLTKDARVISY